MASLMALATKTGNITLMGVLNDVRERCVINNDSGYRVTPDKKLCFPCSPLLIFLYVKPSHMHIEGALEISN